jgi:hypothetical protein
LSGRQGSITWDHNFMGVGYRYQDVYMNIFPLFENKKDAFKLWKKTVSWWPDDKIMLTFVESESNYWFILYCKSPPLEPNTGFVKNIPMSNNFQKFKQGVEKIAILRFGIYKIKPESTTGGKDPDYDLELLKKSKMVYNIAFQRYKDLMPDSAEFECIKSNELDV